MGFFSDLVDGVGDIFGTIGDIAKPLVSTFTGGFSDVLDTFGLSGKDVFSAASAAIPYFLTAEGQKEINQANMLEAEKNRAFQAGMWDKSLSANRQFQSQQQVNQTALQEMQAHVNRSMMNDNFNFLREMGSNQWQRSVADMKAAGLSPMLAYSKGGNVGGSAVGGYVSAGQASSGNASPTGGAQATLQSGIPAAFQSAYQMAMMRENLEQSRAQTAKMQEEARTSKMEGDLKDIQRVWYAKDVQRVHAMIDNVIAQTNLSKEQARRVDSEIMRNIRAGNWDEVRRALAELEIPHAVVMKESIAQGKGPGSFGGIIGGARSTYLPYLQDISRMVHSAAEAANIRAFRR